jgi:hypothetical protein
VFAGAQINAQFLHNVMEYKLGFGGKFLSYYTQVSNAASNTNGSVRTIETINPLTGQKTVITTPEPGTNKKEIDKKITPPQWNNIDNKKAAMLSHDSLVMESYHQGGTAQFFEDKQIWIIKYITTAVLVPYFTIQNKASGKYLTHTQTGNKYFVDVRQLINGNNEEQHWRVVNFSEPSPTGFPFYGKTKLIGFQVGDHVVGGILYNSIPFLNRNRGDGKIGIEIYPGTNILNHSTSAREIVTNPTTAGMSPGFNFFVTPVAHAIAVNLTNIDYPNTPICPTALLHGDRDYNGFDILDAINNTKTNPTTTLNINLTISENKKEIWARVKLNVKEEKKDRSETEGTWNYKVYTAPDGKLLSEIISDKDFYMQLQGNIDRKTFYNQTTWNNDFIDYCVVIGDTMGDDISTDNNCSDDTRIEKIIFKPLYVKFL